MADGANSGYTWQVVSTACHHWIGSVALSAMDFGFSGAMGFAVN